MCGIRMSASSLDQGYMGKDLTPYRQAWMNNAERGPDSHIFQEVGDHVLLGFHRLALMDPSSAGDQPFVMQDGDTTWTLICNGEIYNRKQLVEQYGLSLKSKSDCEVLIHLIKRFGFETMISLIDGEFACIAIESTGSETTIWAARDPIGVRPLFIGTKDGEFGLCSELKGLVSIFDEVKVFTPGTWMKYMLGKKPEYHTFYDYTYLRDNRTFERVLEDVSHSLTHAVEKRIHADRPLGALLSGGLDSSLICALAQRMLPQGHRLKTFTIGMEGGTDLPFAQMVADHIGSDHMVFMITMQEALRALEDTIYAIESYDITSVRASVWQYLLGQKIASHSDVKALLCGELSDELFAGYKYFHNAPDSEQMHQENIRLIRDIHCYDGLRTDRTMAFHGLEVRLPFADPEVIATVLKSDPNYRMPREGYEKWLLRKSFDGLDLLPNAVLWRSKEAFSDGVSQKTKSWFEILQEHIECLVSDEEFENQSQKIIHCRPRTKEAYYYRTIFERHFGKKSETVIPYFWLPRWCGDIQDPSARVLSVYE